MDATTTASAESRRDARKQLGTNALGIGLSLLATIVGLIILAWAILFITKGRFLKPYFEDYTSDQAQRRVAVAGDFQLYLNPIDIKFLAEGLTIANPAWASRKNFFESKRIDTSIATVPLIFGERRMNWLDLVDGNVDMEWDSTGTRNTWTLGDPNRKGEPFELPLIRRASIVGSDLRYRAPQMDFVADVKFETVRARDTAFESDIRFSGGGSSKGKPFTVSGSLMSPNQTVRGGRNKLALHATGAGNVLDVSGTLPGATEIEGADLKLEVRGPNIHSLFDFLGVVVPDTRRYRFTSSLTKRDDRWRFTGLRGTFGDSDLAGAMTISMPANRLRIDADLTSRVLDIVDAGPWVGYDPERLDRMGPSGAIEREGGRPRVLPDASLDVAGLRAFDAHVDYRVRTVRMENFPVSNIGLTLDLDRSLLKLSPLTFDVAGGHLASDIVINARGRPVRTDYDIRLSPTRMGLLLAKFGADQSGTTGLVKARVQLKGTGDSVRESLASSNGRIAFIMPAGTFWTRNVQLSELDIGTFVQKMWEKKLTEPVLINCGLIAFTVRNGIAAADPILIDTKKNVIGGRGGFSFKTESLDLAIEADAKTFSAFSAQSPIGVGGYFAAPSIDPISGELVARAGIGIGLGALVSPLAAIIAFVDPGDAEPTNCGPVLAGARAAAQREKDGGPVQNIGTGKTANPEDKPKKKRKKFLGIF
ncbi:AsmA family protein [Sphingosinicella sp. LY1275]|uniref:AsmA family protein n=1 Tax=Sphingosinicella sp. LY1275 TaxID=3095379 RepID=UPI002ADEC0CF|nr:AsmA family protein [Sphingosinicella sp. LY1275]MEA1014290.1 AsmA family protein [Sphingosinicella sp. LY1275]